MSKPKVLILGKFSLVQKELDELNYDIKRVTSQTREEFFADLKTKYSDIEIIMRENAPKHFYGIDENFVAHLPSSVKIIAVSAAGYDDIDIDALAKRNIWVTNTRGAVDDATADTGLFLLLGCLRNFWPSQKSIRAGEWRGKSFMGHDPKEKLLGILGMGGIGKALAKRAIALGMNIQYNNRSRLEEDVERTYHAQYVSFATLLSTSDVIIISLPLNSSTKHLIGKKEIEQMKKGVIIINVARGPILDETEIVAGLESGHIASVGLDVFENEPEVHPGLIAHERSMLLPHIGTATEESLREMELLTLENVASLVTTQKPKTPVNQPVAAPPPKKPANTFDEAEEAQESVEPQSGESAFWMISRNPKRASKLLSQLDFSDLEIKL